MGRSAEQRDRLEPLPPYVGPAMMRDHVPPTAGAGQVEVATPRPQGPTGSHPPPPRRAGRPPWPAPSSRRSVALSSGCQGRAVAQSTASLSPAEMPAAAEGERPRLRHSSRMRGRADCDLARGGRSSLQALTTRAGTNLPSRLLPPADADLLLALHDGLDFRPDFVTLRLDLLVSGHGFQLTDRLPERFSPDHCCSMTNWRLTPAPQPIAAQCQNPGNQHEVGEQQHRAGILHRSHMHLERCLPC
jgi:hypothetical protein